MSNHPGTDGGRGIETDAWGDPISNTAPTQPKTEVKKHKPEVDKIIGESSRLSIEEEDAFDKEMARLGIDLHKVRINKVDPDLTTEDVADFDEVIAKINPIEGSLPTPSARTTISENTPLTKDDVAEFAEVAEKLNPIETTQKSVDLSLTEALEKAAGKPLIITSDEISGEGFGESVNQGAGSQGFIIRVPADEVAHWGTKDRGGFNEAADAALVETGDDLVGFGESQKNKTHKFPESTSSPSEILNVPSAEDKNAFSVAVDTTEASSGPDNLPPKPTPSRKTPVILSSQTPEAQEKRAELIAKGAELRGKASTAVKKARALLETLKKPTLDTVVEKTVPAVVVTEGEPVVEIQKTGASKKFGLTTPRVVFRKKATLETPSKDVMFPTQTSAPTPTITKEQVSRAHEPSHAVFESDLDLGMLALQNAGVVPTWKLDNFTPEERQIIAAKVERCLSLGELLTLLRSSNLFKTNCAFEGPKQTGREVADYLEKLFSGDRKSFKEILGKIKHLGLGIGGKVSLLALEQGRTLDADDLDSLPEDDSDLMSSVMSPTKPQHGVTGAEVTTARPSVQFPSAIPVQVVSTEGAKGKAMVATEVSRPKGETVATSGFDMQGYRDVQTSNEELAKLRLSTEVRPATATSETQVATSTEREAARDEQEVGDLEKNKFIPAVVDIQNTTTIQGENYRRDRESELQEGTGRTFQPQQVPGFGAAVMGKVSSVAQGVRANGLNLAGGLAAQIAVAQSEGSKNSVSLQEIPAEHILHLDGSDILKPNKNMSFEQNTPASVPVPPPPYTISDKPFDLNKIDKMQKSKTDKTTLDGQDVAKDANYPFYTPKVTSEASSSDAKLRAMLPENSITTAPSADTASAVAIVPAIVNTPETPNTSEQKKSLSLKENLNKALAKLQEIKSGLQEGSREHARVEHTLNSINNTLSNLGKNGAPEGKAVVELGAYTQNEGVPVDELIDILKNAAQKLNENLPTKESLEEMRKQVQDLDEQYRAAVEATDKANKYSQWEKARKVYHSAQEMRDLGPSQKSKELQDLADTLYKNSEGYFEAHYTKAHGEGGPWSKEEQEKQDLRTKKEASLVSVDYRNTGSEDGNYQAAMEILKHRRELKFTEEAKQVLEGIAKTAPVVAEVAAAAPVEVAASVSNTRRSKAEIEADRILSESKTVNWAKVQDDFTKNIITESAPSARDFNAEKIAVRSKIEAAQKNVDTSKVEIGKLESLVAALKQQEADIRASFTDTLSEETQRKILTIISQEQVNIENKLAQKKAEQEASENALNLALTEEKEIDLAISQAKSVTTQTTENISMTLAGNDLITDLGAPKQVINPPKAAPIQQAPVIRSQSVPASENAPRTTPTTPEPTPERASLTPFDKKIADQVSVQKLADLLISKEYADHMFGTGTRIVKGADIANRISQNILISKIGDQIDPYFFIPDRVIADKVHQLLTSRGEWEEKMSQNGLVILEKASERKLSPDTVKSIEKVIDTVSKAAKPGIWERIKNWTKKDSGVEKKEVRSPRTPFALSLLAALGLYAIPSDTQQEQTPEPVQITAAAKTEAPEVVKNVTEANSSNPNFVGDTRFTVQEATQKLPGGASITFKDGQATVAVPKTNERVTGSTESGVKESVEVISVAPKTPIVNGNLVDKTFGSAAGQQRGVDALVNRTFGSGPSVGNVSVSTNLVNSTFNGSATESELNSTPSSQPTPETVAPTSPEVQIVPETAPELPKSFESMNDFKSWLNKTGRLGAFEQILTFAKGMEEKSATKESNNRAFWWETMLFQPKKDIIPEAGNRPDLTTQYRNYNNEETGRTAAKELPILDDNSLAESGKLYAKFDNWYNTSVVPTVNALEGKMTDVEKKFLSNDKLPLGVYLAEVVRLSQKYSVGNNLNLENVSQDHIDDVARSLSNTATSNTFEQGNPGALRVLSTSSGPGGQSREDWIREHTGPQEGFSRDANRQEYHPSEQVTWLDSDASRALGVRIGSIDDARYWFNHEFNQMISDYRGAKDFMKINGLKYTTDDLLFMRNTFSQLRDRTEKLGDIYQRGSDYTFELGQVDSVLKDIDKVLRGEN